MVFGIADDSDTDPQASRDSSFGNRVGRVVCAFGVDVGAKVLQQLLDIRFTEEDDVIDGAQGGNQRSARRLRKNRTPGTF